ncbi:MAG: YceI family protein [Egibacteraceae bacterium]
MVPAGTYSFGPSEGRLVLRVYREGLASSMGHDLVLEATRWSAEATVDGDDPTRSSLTATADVQSLEVREAKGGAKPLSDKDRADIKKNIEKVLSTRRYSEIVFRSTAVRPPAGNRLTVAGELTIKDATRPAELELTVEDGRATASTTVVQSQWGIKPFSALMGALKVRDAVEIEVEVSVPKD